MTDRPELLVCLTGKGKLQYRLPQKGARWRGAFKDMAELMQEVIAKMEPPFIIRYVPESEKDKQ